MPLTVVHFAHALSAADIVELRAAYGLSLERYLPEWAYLERLTPEVIERLGRDPRIRACVPHDSTSKLDQSTAPGRASDNVGDREGGRVDPTSFRATLLDDADGAEIARALSRIGAREVQILDDRAAGGRVRVRFALDDRERLPEIAAFDDVVLIEATSPMKSDDGSPEVAASGVPADVAALWDRGLHGEGQVIGVVDNGPLDLGHCFFADAERNAPGPGHRKVIAVRNASRTPAGRHATFVSACVAGDDGAQPGAHRHRGIAWAARVVSGNRNDLERSSTVFAELTAAMAAGAFIHTNSWHFDTAGRGMPARYTEDAADVDGFAFLNEEHLVLGSAGNSREEQGPPGTAKNAICVGAARVDEEAPVFGDGNPGPTADGRRKPDVMASGCGVESALQGTVCETGRFSLIKRCATSFATPRAAGAAALVRQYFTEGWHPTGTPRAQDAATPSGALLKAVLVNSSLSLAGNPDRPSDQAGWGLVRLDRLLAFADLARQLVVSDVRHAAGPAAGEVRTHRLDVPPSTAELRVTLVWTDPPPAAIAAANVMVNRLRLEVVAPDGTAHRGGDGVDPVQMVVVSAPVPGRWTVEIHALEVNVGRPGQGYALVATTDTG